MDLRTILTCDMRRDCRAEVTHLDEKGFVYCRAHGIQRREHGKRCRALAKWELDQLAQGKPLAQYEPAPKPKAEPKGRIMP